MKTSICLFVFVLLFVVAAPLWGQGFPLEHFKCYPVLKEDPEVAASVGLLDQFETREDVYVRKALRFCNPVGKFHGNQFFPIEDVRQHLIFYSTFPQAGPLRVASIQNQFGAQRLLLLEPTALAVPTQKAPHDRPEELDHFRCYAAFGRTVGEGVGLRDQFTEPQFTSHFIVNPVAFCNPVEKRHQGVVTPIQNPEAHLTCDAMTRARFEGDASIRNQFGGQDIRVGPPDTLCVPTRKVAWEEIPDLGVGEALDALPSVKLP